MFVVHVKNVNKSGSRFTTGLRSRIFSWK